MKDGVVKSWKSFQSNTHHARGRKSLYISELKKNLFGEYLTLAVKFYVFFRH